MRALKQIKDLNLNSRALPSLLSIAFPGNYLSHSILEYLNVNLKFYKLRLQYLYENSTRANKPYSFILQYLIQ